LEVLADKEFDNKDLAEYSCKRIRAEPVKLGHNKVGEHKQIDV
jgi:hypothetical protein